MNIFSMLLTLTMHGCDTTVTGVNDFDLDGFTTEEGDCDDFDNQLYPGAPERCDGINNSCAEELPPEEIDDDGDGRTDYPTDPLNHFQCSEQ